MMQCHGASAHQSRAIIIRPPNFQQSISIQVNLALDWKALTGPPNAAGATPGTLNIASSGSRSFDDRLSCSLPQVTLFQDRLYVQAEPWEAADISGKALGETASTPSSPCTSARKPLGNPILRSGGMDEEL